MCSFWGMFAYSVLNMNEINVLQINSCGQFLSTQRNYSSGIVSVHIYSRFNGHQSYCWMFNGVKEYMTFFPQQQTHHYNNWLMVNVDCMHFSEYDVT